MALRSAQLQATLNWAQRVVPGNGLNPGRQEGPVVGTAAPAIGASDASEVYPLVGTLAAGASVTINLSSITDPVFGQALNPTRVYQMIFIGTGAAWKYEPGSVSGLNWFLSGITPAISGAAGEFFAFGGITAVTVNGANKNVTITNLSGSATLTYTFVVILGD